ncbi:MAG TPA: AI-2E family transporter [Gemmatimonadaceae bacterium]|nr:AI-2E family transporter [Gemmatimonadaceae bacterium]
MTQPAAPLSGDRRRVERRQGARLADLTVPEFRRIVVTSALFAVVLILFLWMVRTVLIAGLLAAVVAVYLRPLCLRIERYVGSGRLAAIISIALVLVPLVAAAVYSVLELRGATEYVSTHQDEVVARIDSAAHRLPFLESVSLTEQIRAGVVLASNYGTEIVESIQEAIIELAVATAVFLFTAFYVLTDTSTISSYVRDKIPARYVELAAALERNVRGVLYGAIYATLVTQTAKSLVILGMNLVFDVPLAVVLAMLSFVVGFFPIVGSWSVYVPVAAWLVVFRDDWLAAGIMLAVGFLGNTLFISMYVRPKIAAEKSRVLNFFWMFIGLVTGVYTFGIAGILLGPVIIGLLKAVLDTVTASANWRLLDTDEEPLRTGPIVTESTS